MTSLRSIDTLYRGYRFRSRLEARWAVAFDVMGVGWDYEPEGFVLPSGRPYLPDFRVQLADGTLWVEVKPEGGDVSLFEGFMASLRDDSRGTVLSAIPFARQDGVLELEGGRNGYDCYFAGGGAAVAHQFCACSYCGNAGFQFRGWASRIGCCTRNSRDGGISLVILCAFRTARTARFEYGEEGLPVAGFQRAGGALEPRRDREPDPENAGQEQGTEEMRGR